MPEAKPILQKPAAKARKIGCIFFYFIKKSNFGEFYLLVSRIAI